MQRRAFANKIKHGFNISNVEQEFCLLYGEVGEAYEAYLKQHSNLGEELADIAIYLLGLSEILKIDLNSEVIKKMEINEKREYVKVNGILVKKGSKDDIE